MSLLGEFLVLIAPLSMLQIIGSYTPYYEIRRMVPEVHNFPFEDSFLTARLYTSPSSIFQNGDVTSKSFRCLRFSNLSISNRKRLQEDTTMSESQEKLQT